MVARGASLYEMGRELEVSPEELVKVLLSARLPKRIPKLDMFVYLHERGFTREEVMKVLKLSKPQYYAYRVKARKWRSYYFPRRTKLKEMVEHLRREGCLSADELARRLGTSRTAVVQLVHRARKAGLVKTNGMKGDGYRICIAPGTGR